ncbi:MAG: cell division protein ZapA [Bacteroidetes bacterium]|nr:cell division protein ZapA [Bacteroidota bacterium]
MMNKLSIRIKICDRIYPMKIEKDEEALIRETAKKINDKITEYKTQFGTNENQDLLAITAFDLMLELLKVNKTFSQDTIEIKNDILKISENIEKVL